MRYLTNRAQIRGQIPPYTRGEPVKTAKKKADTPETAAVSIWPLVASICVSADVYFAGTFKFWWSGDVQR